MKGIKAMCGEIRVIRDIRAMGGMIGIKAMGGGLGYVVY